MNAALNAGITEQDGQRVDEVVPPGVGASRRILPE